MHLVHHQLSLLRPDTQYEFVRRQRLLKYGKFYLLVICSLWHFYLTSIQIRFGFAINSRKKLIFFVGSFVAQHKKFVKNWLIQINIFFFAANVSQTNKKCDFLIFKYCGVLIYMNFIGATPAQTNEQESKNNIFWLYRYEFFFTHITIVRCAMAASHTSSVAFFLYFHSFSRRNFFFLFVFQLLQISNNFFLNNA